MSAPIPGRLPTHRCTAIVQYRCYADPRYFLVWADVPEVLKEELYANDGLPCGDRIAGEPGVWCEPCRFGAVEELAVIAHQRSKEAS